MTIAAAQRKLKPWPPYQFGVFVFGDFANFRNLTISGKAWHLPTSVMTLTPFKGRHFGVPHRTIYDKSSASAGA